MLPAFWRYPAFEETVDAGRVWSNVDNVVFDFVDVTAAAVLPVRIGDEGIR